MEHEPRSVGRKKGWERTAFSLAWHRTTGKGGCKRMDWAMLLQGVLPHGLSSLGLLDTK